MTAELNRLNACQPRRCARELSGMARHSQGFDRLAGLLKGTAHTVKGRICATFVRDYALWEAKAARHKEMTRMYWLRAV